MANDKPSEFESEFEEEPFNTDGFESVDEVIPFDAEEEEPSTISDGPETEGAENSILLMGPAGASLSDELDISDIINAEEFEKEGSLAKTTRKEEKKRKHSHADGFKKRTFNFGRFFIGIVFVFVGLVFLGQNMGWFNIVQVDLLSLWPVILIFLGLSMFNARRWWSKVLGLVAVLIVVLLVMAALLGGSNIVNVNLTGEIVEEEREVVSFSRISLEGVGSMVIEEGDVESLTLRADKALLPKIETLVSGNTLTLQLANPFFQFLFFNNVDIDYLITVKDIEAITISGAGSVTGSDIKTDSLEISINGSGEVILDIDVEEFVARISGSGKYEMTGVADRQIIHINGSGKYFGKDVVSVETGIRISGSGEVEVYAEEELNVTINGSGKVRYLGEPFVSNSAISGSGSIERFDTEISDVLKNSSVLDKLRRIDEADEFDIGIEST